eukprot:TRINITY_DN1039_c0_g1_i1.p1 TRINITY_DN1039_c0_g1~~TRINITY_DN1039_c0_g1_i1.p1  ORF type:complete len:330 (-),score=78.81 TRINITY_DN1039_c0_g1_i1:70-1059(-)
MPKGDTAQRKQSYTTRITKIFDQYQQILVVGIDNIGSDHMQQIRRSTRGLCEIVCGKNTLIRRAIRLQLKANPSLEALSPHVKGNVALVFTKESLAKVRTKLLELKVEAPAKPGSIAPNPVVVPKGATGLEPTKTSFLQALNIPTKINRGQIEILNDKVLVEAGQKVGPSEATLLQMLKINPFSYGLTIETVYDNGSVYDTKMLDISDDQVFNAFQTGVQRVACFSLAVGYPTIASFPHSIANGYKRVLSVALATDYSFPKADLFKQMAANPTAFAVQAPAPTTAAAPKPAETKTEAKPEKDDAKDKDDEDAEEEDVGAGGMFGGDDDW